MKVRIVTKRPGTANRGFAALKYDAPDYLRELCSEGGKAAHRKKTAHEWTSAEASAAGKKGGRVSAERRRERLAAQQRQEAV